MTRRRNPPPRPQRPNRPNKEKDTLDNDLRLARATRKAESQQKQQLRRREWNSELDGPEEEFDFFELGEDAEEPTGSADPGEDEGEEEEERK